MGGHTGPPLQEEFALCCNSIYSVVICFMSQKKLLGRTSMRLKGYDYSNPGSYFITIILHNNKNLFGEVFEDRVVLNAAGKMVEKWWHEIPNKFPAIETDQYIIMPNHFHAIISVTLECNTTLGNLIGWFKTMTTNEYIRKVRTCNWHPFDKKLWHRDYYERIIRNQTELDTFRQYILNNPSQWTTDTQYTSS